LAPADHTGEKPGEVSTARSRFPGWRFRTFAVGLFLVAGAVLLRFGGYLLVLSDSPPAHAQVAIVLAGSVSGEEARRAQALKLLRQGSVDRVMFHVGRVWYWGQWVPDMARQYIRKEYGNEIAQHVLVCEMNASSTEEEALGFRRCLDEHRWRSIVLVTSDYHTRRARLIWGAVLAKADPPFSFRITGVKDGDFEAGGWWRKREYAKTWLLEFTKLIWTYVELAAGSVPKPSALSILDVSS